VGVEARQARSHRPGGGQRPEDLKAKALAVLHRLQKLPHIVQGFRDQNLRYITA
jgi:hypothetical protein